MPTTIPRSVQPRRRGKPAKGEQKIDVSKALQQRLQGLSYEQIGKLQGNFTPQSVQWALKRFDRFLTDPIATNAYRANKSALWEAAEEVLSTALTDPVAIKKASLNNRAYTFSQIRQAVRDEKGPQAVPLALPGFLSSALSVSLRIQVAVNNDVGPTTASVVPLVENEIIEGSTCNSSISNDTEHDDDVG